MLISVTVDLKPLVPYALEKGYEWVESITLELEKVVGSIILSALRVNLNGWEEVIKDSCEFWHVTSSDLKQDLVKYLDGPELPQVDLVIFPAIKGSGGAFRLIAGVALIGLSFLIPGSGFLLNMGVAFALGGVIELLTPKQQDKDKDRQSSYLFSSAQRNTQDSDPVPLLFGTYMMTGIPVLSQDISQAVP
jgi:predicted phage tail protein